MHKASLWKLLKDKTVQCQLCNHFCVLKDKEKGKCGVRINVKGELYSLVYDKIAALNVDPIEKKPLYHFYPGSSSLSIGTMGCNFFCVFCQNYSLSHPPKTQDDFYGDFYSPDKIVKLAISYECKSISYTYSEPTIFFELLFDISHKAKEEGLVNVLVSNGFMSSMCLQQLKDVVDGINVDLKAFSEDFYEKLCGGSLKPVLKNLEKMKEMGWWVEITTLLIPGYNDSDKELEDIAKFIMQNLGSDVPWHISRFHPAYKLLTPSVTPFDTLLKAYETGKKYGLKYVYLGNVPGSEQENTYCPKCGSLLIRRNGYFVQMENINNGKCRECGESINGVGLP